MDNIPAGLLTGGGITGVLVVLFWLLATGRLVTGAAHLRELAAKDQQLASAERLYEARIAAVEHASDQRAADKDAQIVMWRAVGETSQAQMSETLEHSRLSVQLLQAIERRAQEQADHDKGRGS